MDHPAPLRSRCGIALLTLCIALVAADAHAAKRKSTHKKAAAANTVIGADSPGAPGSLVRRSPWAMLSDLPNFTEGVWGNKNSISADSVISPPLKAEFNTAATTTGSSMHTATCTPFGMPGVMTQPYPLEFVFEPGRVVMLLELSGLTRRVYTDGRAHPDTPTLSYTGHSIGHWEKNTLVIDTVGIAPGVQIAPGIAAQGPVHIVERVRLINADALLIDTSVDASEVLSKVWNYSMTYQRHRDWNIQEYACGIATTPRGVLSSTAQDAQSP